MGNTDLPFQVGPEAFPVIRDSQDSPGRKSERFVEMPRSTSVLFHPRQGDRLGIVEFAGATVVILEDNLRVRIGDPALPAQQQAAQARAQEARS